jgi:RPA family protein
MDGAARVFAGEFSRATLIVPPKEPGSAGWVVTPGGAWCRNVIIAGALTEVIENGDLIRCRVADPTGAFDVVCGGRNAGIARDIRNLSVPSFVLVSGSASAYRKNGDTILSVRPDHVQIIDRTCRDQFMLTTAEYSLRRLDLLWLALAGRCTDDRLLQAARHYAVTPAMIGELAQMIGQAVQGIPPQESGPAAGQADVKAMILELMQNAPGPRGIAVEEILDILAGRGIRKEETLAALEALIVDDECYQPQKGYVRLL